MSATHRGDVLITASELHERLGGAPNMRPTVLDVRWALGDPNGYTHFRAGHIPGGVYVDLDRELAGRASPGAGRHPLPGIDDLTRNARRWGVHGDRTTVVYDDNGGLAAARAWWLLRWAGVKPVRILDGALAAWRSCGFEIERGDGVAPAESDITLHAGGMPTLDAEGAASLARTGVLLDARATERYLGEHEPIDPRAGHIPAAVSAPAADCIAANGAFRDASLLRERYAALGVHADAEVGVYCGSGVTAAVVVAALALTGVDAALYPGSWSQWSADPSRPIAVG